MTMPEKHAGIVCLGSHERVSKRKPAVTLKFLADKIMNSCKNSKNYNKKIWNKESTLILQE